jgi:ribonuclease P protein component
MLHKENRLTTNFEFNIAKKYGQYYPGKLFHMYVLKPNNYTGATKVGFVVSNNFHKNAVKRNYVKRVFREVTRKAFDKIAPDDFWIVIYPKTRCLTSTYEEISADFNKTIQKVSFAG